MSKKRKYTKHTKKKCPHCGVELSARGMYQHVTKKHFELLPPREQLELQALKVKKILNSLNSIDINNHPELSASEKVEIMREIKSAKLKYGGIVNKSKK